MSYTQIPVDFEVFKALTALRPDPTTTENDVLRTLLKLPPATAEIADFRTGGMWHSDGVHFPVGTRLRHRFRNGLIVEARITESGIQFGDKVYAGFSPAAMAAGGTHANGWNFWEVETRGKWLKATSLRQ
ncbi:hypothetical protein [Sphingomonas sp.]|uniref:hypothetical protein n=1 Tax=Sphingomonas sp. TaxID=28214 RepID=UPI003340D34B